MLMLMFILFFIMLLSSLMLLLNTFISKKSLLSREKISPFECGFDPMSANHMPFSVHFFMISLIFLIFDIEIALLIPMIPIFSNKFNISILMTLFTFLIILILGLYIEYAEQSIDWKL